MNRLFVKIFLWFWLAMVVMGLALAWTTAQLGGREIPPMFEHARQSFQDDAATAWRLLDSEGPESLRRWYADPAHRRVLVLYLVDPSGRDLLGQRLPPPLRRFAFMPEPYLDEAPAVRSGQVVVHSLAVPGQGYVRLIAVFRPPHPVWYLFTFSRLLVALFVSALVCWGLAHYLSAPVRRLREVAQRLAAGELEARVEGRLLGRRDEVGRLASDLNVMATRLQGLLESQQRLLADISHELRSPLARLQVAVGLARRHESDGIASELDRIEREADRLNELIGGVLTLTRLNSGVEQVDECLDLVDIVDSIVRDADFEASERQRRVDLSCDPGPMYLHGNGQLLRSAIENVVRNALHYTAEGTSVEVTLTRRETADGLRAVCRVRDHGPGIDEDRLEEVFEPFVRVQAARDRESGGVGLGLSIARRAIELHGGTIRARNLDDGLLVEVSLPIGHEEAGRVTGRSTAGSEG